MKAWALLGGFVFYCGGFATARADGTTPDRDNPQSVDDIPFVCGALEIPQRQGNNAGVLDDQLVPGLTHVQMYLQWRFLEPEKDQWDWREFDENVAHVQRKHLKVAIQPGQMFPAYWFKKTPDYTPMVDIRNGKAIDFISPWAPGTRIATEHFFAALAAHCTHGEIDSIDFEYPGSDFGEIGLFIGGGSDVLPGGSQYPYFPQDPAAWKPGGWWCGDAFARKDFQDRMMAKYGGLDALNTAWETHFDLPDHLEYPDVDHHKGENRRWVDFMTWLTESQSRNLADMIAIIHHHFPEAIINIPMGFGSDRARDACDRTGVCKALADIKPLVIRSTHAAFNRGQWPLAYWFYKRMAPTAHALGEGFGIETPGGDLTPNELMREMFEDASAGVNFVYQYYQNFHLTPDVVNDYKHILRPQEHSLVDIGVLFPSTQMMLDENEAFPPGQIEFCDAGRDYFDYDLVDENMIGWGMLKNYKVLLHTGGSVFRDATFPALTEWLNRGGILITHGLPGWEDLDGRNQASAWLAEEDTAASTPDVRVFHVGQGRLYVAMGEKIPAYLLQVVDVLKKTPGLHGFDGVADGCYSTDFPDGRLRFATKTYATTFNSK